MTDDLQIQGPIHLRTATIQCWQCGASTPVHALVATNVLDPDEGSEPSVGDEPIRSFVYDIGESDMPTPLVGRLAEMAPNYIPTFSATTQDTTWANRCVACGSLQGAHFLHSEPDGPFFGGAEDADAPNERLVQEDGFAVAAGSYSL